MFSDLLLNFSPPQFPSLKHDANNAILPMRRSVNGALFSPLYTRWKYLNPTTCSVEHRTESRVKRWEQHARSTNSCLSDYSQMIHLSGLSWSNIKWGWPKTMLCPLRMLMKIKYDCRDQEAFSKTKIFTMWLYFTCNEFSFPWNWEVSLDIGLSVLGL